MITCARCPCPVDGTGWPGEGDEVLCQECWESACAESFWEMVRMIYGPAVS